MILKYFSPPRIVVCCDGCSEAVLTVAISDEDVTACGSLENALETLYCETRLDFPRPGYCPKCVLKNGPVPEVDEEPGFGSLGALLEAVRESNQKE